MSNELSAISDCLRKFREALDASTWLLQTTADTIETRARAQHLSCDHDIVEALKILRARIDGNDSLGVALEREFLTAQSNDRSETARTIAALNLQLSAEQAKADKWRSLFERQRFIDTCSTAERVVEQNAIDLAVVMLSGDTPQPPKRSTLS